MNEFQAITGEYKRQFIEDILTGMEHLLDNKQLSELNKSLYYNTNNLDFADNPSNHDLDYEKTNEILIKEFLKAKKTKGLSKTTISYYTYTINNLKKWTIKSFLELTSEDLKEFLIFYQAQHNCSKTSVNNVRRNLSSFFRFLTDNEKILINPMLRIPPIKEPKKVKKAFTYDEIEKMRWALNKDTYLKHTKELSILSIRRQAMFELFLSSGLRVSELIGLKIENVDFDECKAIVLGKGNKERIVYFSEKAKNYIQQYLSLRNDDNSHVFIGRNNKTRIKHISSVEQSIRELGREVGVEAHPHKFRRTFCTNMIKKGMPIDQVQKLMGHESIETTLRYLDMDDETVAMAHKKFTNF